MTHTPGPWFWNVNPKSKSVRLEALHSGCLTVMDFSRWGTNSATVRFRNELCVMEDAKNLMVQVSGREHHEYWFQTINHPDAKLISMAPELLDACKDAVESLLCGDRLDTLPTQTQELIDRLQSVIDRVDG